MDILDYAPRTEFDTGRFVARYFEVLAWLSIVYMIVEPIFFDRLNISLSFIFLFWAAGALKRHSATARKWVLAISGLILLACVGMLVQVAVRGTKGTTVHLGGQPIHDPEVWQVLAAVASCAVLVGIPFAILLSRTARRQFANPVVSTPASPDGPA